MQHPKPPLKPLYLSSFKNIAHLLSKGHNIDSYSYDKKPSHCKNKTFGKAVLCTIRSNIQDKSVLFQESCRQIIEKAKLVLQKKSD